MVDEVSEWGIKAEAITTDSWYSSKQNLKFFRDKELNERGRIREKPFSSHK